MEGMPVGDALLQCQGVEIATTYNVPDAICNTSLAHRTNMYMCTCVCMTLLNNGKLKSHPPNQSIRSYG